MTRKQRQQLFNKAVLAIVAQGEPCRSIEGGYAYQRFLTQDDGSRRELRCAIGWLMEGDLLQSKQFISGLYYDQKYSGTPLLLDGVLVGDDDTGFLSRLQRAHDYAANGSTAPGPFMLEFKRRVAEVAADYGLTVPEAARLEPGVADVTAEVVP